MMHGAICDYSISSPTRRVGPHAHFSLGLGTLSMEYAGLRHVEIRGIFQISEENIPKGLDQVHSELIALWQEYAETIPARDGSEKCLRVEGWTTLRKNLPNPGRFVSIQEVIDSEYPDRHFLRAYHYFIDRPSNKYRKSGDVANQSGITDFLEDFNQKSFGIDLDSTNEFVRLKTYLNCRGFSSITGEQMLTRISPSGRGLHMKIRSEEIIPRETRYRLRMALGDCRGRLYFSERKDYDDVLFDYKRKKRNGRWHRWTREYDTDSSSILALPFISMIPRGARRN